MYYTVADLEQGRNYNSQLRGGRGIKREEAAATSTIVIMHPNRKGEEITASSASMLVMPQ